MFFIRNIFFVASFVCLASSQSDLKKFAPRDQWTTSTQPSPSTLAARAPQLNITVSPTSRSEFLSRARQSVDLLQKNYYSTWTGLYSLLWWNSANALTTLSDLAALDPALQSTAEGVYSDTFLHAQLYNTHLWRGIIPGFISSGKGFLNDYYDDEGWWAWAWLKAYDQTKRADYLSAAITIFNDQVAGYHASCGALLWSKKTTYNGAIANELFLFVSAALANRVDASQKQNYLNWALKEWNWFEASGLINAANLINDGLDGTTCKNNNGDVWTYNQGVILAGLVELHTATTADPANTMSPYLVKALTLARASMTLNPHDQRSRHPERKMRPGMHPGRTAI